MDRCTAKTARGTRCKRRALQGSDPALCVTHHREAGPPADVADRLVQLLQAGNYVKTALTAVGLAKATFYDWLERGDPDGSSPGDAPFRAFRERIDQAKAEGEARNVTLVARAAATDWKAAAWMLERQFPERWARTAVRSSASPVRTEDGLDDLERRRAARLARRSAS